MAGRYKDWEGFYWTGSVANEYKRNPYPLYDTLNAGVRPDEIQQRATIEPRFDLGLIRNPSQWVCAVERLEVNVNSIPFWEFDPAFGTPVIDITDPVPENQNAAITFFSHNGYFWHINIPDRKYYSLNEVVDALNWGCLRAIHHRELVLWFFVENGIRIRMLIRLHHPVQKGTLRTLVLNDHIMFHGGLHQILGCSPTVQLYNPGPTLQVEAGQNPWLDGLFTQGVRNLDIPADVFHDEAFIGDYPNRKHPRTSAGDESIDQKDNDFQDEDGNPIGPSDFTPQPKLDFNNMLFDQELELTAVRDPALMKNNIDVWKYVFNGVRADTKCLNLYWSEALNDEDWIQFISFVTTPRADCRDDLQHIFIEVLGLTIESDRFDIGYESIMTDFGGLSGSFGSTSRHDEFNYEPRQKIVYNPSQRRLLNMSGTAPITWFRITCKYRNWNGKFQEILLSPGESFHIKLAFFKK